VQGISWQKLTLTGVGNHAGTTPMSMRADAGLAAARIATMVRELMDQVGAPMVGTVGHLRLWPNLVNVVPMRAELTVDLRHVAADVLAKAEAECNARARAICEAEGVAVAFERLASFAPFDFDADMVARVRAAAEARGLAHRDMVSGAGHDAQIMGRVAPAAMVFVPSVGGISHNTEEHTELHHLVAGTEVLMDVILGLAEA
jgi:N-carbamoyl-L-amino-acid hydrolase